MIENEMKEMPVEATITRFGLIRHAETIWNRERRIQGQSDSALTDRGQKDAEGWGQCLSQLSWNRIVGSDLGRAVETADIINRHLQIPFDTDSRLREQDWGRWTAKTVAKIEADDIHLLAEDKRVGWRFCPPAGEDRLNVWQRSRQALIDAADKWPGERILIITHEGVIKCLINRLCDLRYVPGESALIESRHLHWLIAGHNGLRIHKINALSL